MLKVIERALLMQEIEELRFLSADHLMQLAETCRERVYRKDDEITQREDSPVLIFLLLQGRVTLEEERSLVFQKAAFNLCHSLAGVVWERRYLCLEDCTVLEVAAADLMDLLLGEPELCLALLKFFATKHLDDSGGF